MPKKMIGSKYIQDSSQNDFLTHLFNISLQSFQSFSKCSSLCFHILLPMLHPIIEGTLEVVDGNVFSEGVAAAFKNQDRAKKIHVLSSVSKNSEFISQHSCNSWHFNKHCSFISLIKTFDTIYTQSFLIGSKFNIQ